MSTDFKLAPTINGVDLATYLGLGTLPLVSRMLAGMTVPANALDRWKAGRGLPYTRLNGAINNSVVAVTLKDPQFFPTALHQPFYVEQEEFFSTAGEAAAGLSGITSVASTGIFTLTAHGLTAGQVVVPTSGILDSFLTFMTPVFVSATNLTANTFSLSATSGGSVLTGSTNDTALTLALATITVATRGSVNGTAAAAHADKAVVTRRRYKTVVHLGDSLVEGTGGFSPAKLDSWSERASRMVGDMVGGLIGTVWPMWRNTSVVQQDQEYALTGATITGNQNTDVGYGGSVLFTGNTANGFVWTRPPGLRVKCIDLDFVDAAGQSLSWSYSLDGGATWIDNPVSTTIWSSGVGLLRRTRIVCDNPTDFRVRAANAAGTNKTIALPYVPLTTWTTVPQPGITEGLLWANCGEAGVKLRQILNARCVTDLATDGVGGATSASATFVAADVGSTIMVNGTVTTIATRLGPTSITTTAILPASGATQRAAIFQNDGTGDRLASLVGHHGSWFPDLVIIGPFVNDEAGATLGDGNSDFYGDMMQYLVTKLQPTADILLVAPHETGGGTVLTATQAAYRAIMHTVATANNVAILDLYDAFAAYGFTGYTAVAAGGYMFDTVHYSYKGNTWIGSHFRRVMSVI